MTDKTSPTLDGQPVTIQEFSAFKAIHAMDVLSEVEGSWRQVVFAMADYRAEYGQKNTMRLSRAEARRQFRAKPLYRARNVVEDDIVTEVIEEPVLDESGQPVLGPDPLEHLTDQDWQASGNELVIPEQPNPDEVVAAMVPFAFKLARVQVLRVIALALTPNRQLEDWDTEAPGDPELLNRHLDDAARRLVHQAAADELIGLAVAVAEKVKAQLIGPFEQARAEFRELLPKATTSTDDATPPPMTIVEGPEDDELAATQEPSSEPTEPEPKPASSTASPEPTAGPPTSSSTDSPGTE